ncbi:hypothetical protein MasN3_40950 [Massilia varians]|uniref:DUF4149 domain-containing protein n=1 Tax=Massilia varians TaxID=457921 RepID=A0ABM8CBB9_9BURK|nr:hypothetical protein [Massilia varians]BDT60601.1 hypothetical protein MasN3_40950 [Massilia varians]
MQTIGSLNNWQRRGLGILALGGGAVGFASSMSAVLQAQVPTTTTILPFTLAQAFFLWGIWCGVQMLEGGRQALYRNALFWLAQVPLLQTPVFGYAVFCGGQLQVFAKLSPFQLGFFGSGFGAQFSLNLGQPGARFAIGVNLLALCMSFWLMRQCERADRALSPAPATPA